MFFWDKIFTSKYKALDGTKLPEHIAIIMDGNGRWARKRGLPRNFGHKQGSSNLKKIVESSSDIGIKYLTVYAFSTENWKRPKSEVDTLMGLLLEYLKNADRELEGKNIRIKVIGDIKGLPKDIQNEVSRVEKMTKNNTGMHFNIALNYGSRDEIMSAVREVVKDALNKNIDPQKIDEAIFSNKLYTAGIPDPDLLIRTSGEQRISNFLLWQLAYSELYFVDVLWPDFSEKHLIHAINEYRNRNRRFGGI